jgi:uncharacterized protein (DUF488 family)
MIDELYTIGHSNQTANDFISLLKKNSINAICDVRSSPFSKYTPQFNKKEIEKKLKENEIIYIFLGKELGARTENMECYVKGKIAYNLLANDPVFKQGIERLENGMKQYKIALMCAEKDPITCHRMILICKEVKDFVKKINHIHLNGDIETNSEAEGRLLKLYKIIPDMFKDQDECIEEAYDIQSQKIAYTKK